MSRFDSHTIVYVGAAMLLSILFTGCRSAVTPRTNEAREQATNSEVARAKTTRVVAEGRIEPASGVIGVYAATGDRLLRYEDGIVEGAKVDKGADLGQLQSLRIRQGELSTLNAKLFEATAMQKAEAAAQKADVAAAERTIEQVADSEQRLKIKESEIALLKNAFDSAKLECEKLVRLAKKSDLVSESALAKSKLATQRAKTAWKAAESESEALQSDAKSQLAVAKAKRDSISATHDRALATIPTESLKEQAKLLEEQVKQARMPAPIDGTILKINTQPGEAVVNEPLMLIADLSKIVCVTEVYETYLNKLSVGQEATLHSPTFGKASPLRGRVASIGRIIMTPDLKPLDPFAKSDVRVVEVRIEIDGGSDSKIASRLMNLRVDVEIATD